MKHEPNNTLPIRAWWGFRRSDVSPKDFIHNLGSIFFPATLHVLGRMGNALQAYLPTVVIPSGYPDVPDEVALVVYKSIADYGRANSTLSGRIYQLLHKALFGPPSGSQDFPVLYQPRTFTLNQPYYLYHMSNENDIWLRGQTRLFVGIRDTRMTVQQYTDKLNDAFLYMSENGTRRGAPCSIIARANRKCVTVWQHWEGNADDQCGNANVALLTAFLQQVFDSVSTPISVDSLPIDLEQAPADWHVSKNGDFPEFQF